MSKIGSEKIKGFVKECLTNRKQRKFAETIDLQIGLKDIDPNKDKRFAGTVKLPNIPRPHLKVCVIADAAHIDKLKKLGDVDYIDAEALKKKIDPNDKKGKELKKWAGKYKLLFVSETLVRQLPKLGGPLDQIRQNLITAINYLVSLLKKNWNNVKSLYIRTTMGHPVKIY